MLNLILTDILFSYNPLKYCVVNKKKPKFYPLCEQLLNKSFLRIEKLGKYRRVRRKTTMHCSIVLFQYIQINLSHILINIICFKFHKIC